MKRFFIVLLSILFIASCASLPDSTYPDIDFELFPGEINWDDTAADIGVELVATSIGYYVGASGDPGIERKIAMHYANIKAGRIDLVAINEGLSWLVSNTVHPLVGILATTFLNRVGAVFDAGGTLVKLDIPPEVWEKAEVAYQNGLLLGKTQLVWVNNHMYAGR